MYATAFPVRIYSNLESEAFSKTGTRFEIYDGCKLNHRFNPDGQLYYTVKLYGTMENVRKVKEEMARHVAGRDRWSFWGLPGIIKKAF